MVNIFLDLQTRKTTILLSYFLRILESSIIVLKKYGIAATNQCRFFGKVGNYLKKVVDRYSLFWDNFKSFVVSKGRHCKLSFFLKGVNSMVCEETPEVPEELEEESEETSDEEPEDM